MRGLGTIVATLALLAPAPAAGAAVEGTGTGEEGAVPERTREQYKAAVEPICAANRDANAKIMAGARQRVNRNQLAPAGRQFIRLSDSLAGFAKRLEKVPPPSGDERRVRRWLHFIRLLKTRMRNVGKHFRDGEKIKGIHESILAERAGLSANNISIVFHFRSCRFSRVA